MSAHTAVRTRASLGRTVRSEWIKLSSIRSTWWTALAMVVVGAGFTTVISAIFADDIASGSNDSAGEFITQGLIFSQISAVVIGALVVTSEYGTGLIRVTLAATPARARVLAAKLIVLCGFLFAVGVATAFIGYFGGNAFFRNAGVGLSLGDDHILRSMFGAGLYMAGLGALAAAVGLILRNTAAAISIVLALVFIIGQVVQLIPGTFGEWVMKLMPGNAGPGIVVPVSFGPDMLSPWTGFAVFVGEIALLVLAGWFVLRRRDA